MRVRYLKENFWTIKIDNNASMIWKNILKYRELFKSLIERQVANGQSTNLWRDPWINSKSFLDKLGWDSYFSNNTPDCKVSTIIQNQNWVIEKQIIIRYFK